MTSVGGTEGRQCPDLPDDLLGAIYSRLFSWYDRARFSAVCTSWRAAASWQPKLPALPLLLPSTGNGWFYRKALAYSPEDGRVLRAPPLFPYGRRIVGSHDGGWVAAAIGCRIDVVNLFTRAWVLTKEDIGCGCRSGSFYEKGRRYPTITYFKFSTRKIVFSEDPASKGCILAALSSRCMTLGRLGGPCGGYTEGRYCRDASLVVDIAFCNGELYGLSSGGDRLYKYAIGLDKYNAPMVISVEEITIQRPATFNPLYMFELRGKLATALEVPHVRNSKARKFKVFELASSNTSERYKCMWAEVTGLGDHALFLGPGCCKAVHVSATTSMHGEVERNCIYYTKQEDDDPKRLARTLDLGSCAVYCYESKGADSSEGIMSRGYHYPQKGHRVNDRNSCSWIFPPRL